MSLIRDGGLEPAETADGVLRLLVARRVGIEAEAIEIGRDARGRPVVHWPATGLHVTISHSAGYIACAVAERELGIDIERDDRVEADAPLADRICTRTERDQLDRTPPAQRRRSLVRLWTRKEALVKALGVGLVLDFAAIDVSSDTPILSGAVQAGWTLRDLPAPSEYCMTLAARARQVRVDFQTRDCL